MLTKTFYLTSEARSTFARHIHTHTKSRSRGSSGHSFSYHFSFFDFRCHSFHLKHLVWAILCLQSSLKFCCTLKTLVLQLLKTLDFHFCRFHCWSMLLRQPYFHRQDKQFSVIQQRRGSNSKVCQEAIQIYREIYEL